MADFSKSGRGAALLKVLEQPVRRPGDTAQFSQTSNPQEGSQKVTNVPIGRGFFGASKASVAQPSQPSSPALPGGTRPPPLGRGLLQHTKTLMPTIPSSNLTPPSSQTLSQSTQQDSLGSLGLLTPPMSQLSIEKKSPGFSQSSEASQQSSDGALALTQLAQPSTSTTKSITEEMKLGSSGSSVRLGVNYLALRAASDTVFQYAVSFSPPVESRNMRYGMLNELTDLIGKTKAFDGAALFLPTKITETSVSRVCKRRTDNVDVTVTITLTNVLPFRECMQLFNIVIRRVLKSLDLSQQGRQFYDQHHPIQVPQHKMELWPGYVTAVHEFDGGLLLLLDVSHKLLRMDTALEFLYELYHSKKQHFQEEATRQLVGSVVLTRYNNRTYRIDDIAWDKNPQSTFVDHTGRAISFIEYYKNAYDCSIEDTEQPLLLHRPKQRRLPRGKDGQNVEQPEQVICLVPELCSMTGLTDAARNDFKVMKDLAVYTRLSPSDRDLAIKKFVKTVNSVEKAKQELKSWGLELHPTMLETNGRRLPSEKILFKNNSVLAGPEADWSKHVVKENVISAVPLHNWLLVFCKRDSSKAMDFFNTLKKVTPSMGIQVSEPVVVELPNDRTETYIRAIKEQVKSSLQMVVIIFPSQRDDRYSSLKKLCCIDSPVPSQVINSRTISQPQKLRSVTQKIALQMNCKMGGELWALDIPLKNLMVVGIDVYHDSSAGKRSVLGLVSSTNKHMTCWFSRVFIQDKNQEIADGLKLGLQSALKRYHEINHTLPERIIVFRDGVGDGQMYTVKEFEVPQMKKCFSLFGDAYKPRMAVVVVQKRISTRIFGQTSNGYDNPSPGTIIDHTITRKGWYDFFLVSQHVRQGTVTPTHYIIVDDKTNLKPDHLQRLTYKLTHMYYNWPGTVRVPAPCQYAHKLAFLVGQSLHKEPSPSICDRLFFL